MTTYTSDETGACVHALARQIVEHVRLERGEARVVVVVKHGDGARLVDALKGGGIQATVVAAADAAYHPLTVEVIVGAWRLLHARVRPTEIRV